MYFNQYIFNREWDVYNVYYKNVQKTEFLGGLFFDNEESNRFSLEPPLPVRNNYIKEQ